MGWPPGRASTLQSDADQQLLQHLQLLVGLLDGAECLHVAGDVEADVVHQRDGVGLLAIHHRPGVLLDYLRKLGSVHELVKHRNARLKIVSGRVLLGST